MADLQDNPGNIDVQEYRRKYPRIFQNFDRLKSIRDSGVSGLKTAGSYGATGLKTAGSYGVKAASSVYNFTQPYIKEYYKDENFGSYQKWFLFIIFTFIILFIILAIVYFCKMADSSKNVNKNKDKNQKIIKNMVKQI